MNVSTVEHRLGLALTELKEQNALIIRSSNDLDGKARAILSSSTLILTLFGTLQLTLPGRVAAQSATYQSAIVIVFLVYAALLFATLVALWPSVYHTPFPATKEETQNVILAQDSSQDALLQLIGNYIGIIKHNQTITNRKAIASKWSIFLIGLLVALLVLLSFVPI